MPKIMNEEILSLQEKLKDLETEEYKARFNEYELNIFKQDFLNTIQLLIE